MRHKLQSGFVRHGAENAETTPMHLQDMLGIRLQTALNQSGSTTDATRPVPLAQIFVCCSIYLFHLRQTTSFNDFSIEASIPAAIPARISSIPHQVHADLSKIFFPDMVNVA